MHFKHTNLDCWYNDVCAVDRSCTGCVRYAEMAYLMENSGIPVNKQRPAELIPDEVDYDAFCQLQDIKLDIMDFVRSGRNLYLWSAHTGNGKTSWSIKMLCKYFNDVWPGNGFCVRGVFVHVPTLLLRLKDFDSKDESLDTLKRNLKACDLVVWDDIASTGLSQYDLSQLLMYIDERILNDKSNIFTGNLSHTELSRVVGSRLASRMYNSSIVVELRGKDRR